MTAAKERDMPEATTSARASARPACPAGAEVCADGAGGAAAGSSAGFAAAAGFGRAGGFAWAGLACAAGAGAAGAAAGGSLRRGGWGVLRARGRRCQEKDQDCSAGRQRIFHEP